jgi:hypothetical protein
VSAPTCRAAGDITAVTTANGSGLSGGVSTGDAAPSLRSCAGGRALLAPRAKIMAVWQAARLPLPHNLLQVRSGHSPRGPGTPLGVGRLG